MQIAENEGEPETNYSLVSRQVRGGSKHYLPHTRPKWCTQLYMSSSVWEILAFVCPNGKQLKTIKSCKEENCLRICISCSKDVYITDQFLMI